ncbi:hypothetical protein ZOSMA_114G00010 [Zostera marina]|uniref:Pentatricopeptide repeat-containing protein n=1 Tax=Zostera marina TaxID=29655 RepID=A0A0K9PSV7_ZOSMR|nr:hypothetical protein ZOSMA_182G00150 [Zostera marina]KMZ75404.1 hypothetical protein ZOSMA_114G00010 [Zostera marina]
MNNVVLDFYTKCRKVNVASKLFETMTDSRNIVSWTTMIAGYMQNSCDTDAMVLFAEMTRSGWAADDSLSMGGGRTIDGFVLFPVTDNGM